MEQKSNYVILFRRVRQRKNYEHAEIDSSPESYRNVKLPLFKEKPIDENYFKAQEGNIPMKNISETTKLQISPYSVDDEVEILECNYYLRRNTPSSQAKDREWILVERDHIL